MSKSAKTHIWVGLEKLRFETIAKIARSLGVPTGHGKRLFKSYKIMDLIDARAKNEPDFMVLANSLIENAMRDVGVEKQTENYVTKRELNTAAENAALAVVKSVTIDEAVAKATDVSLRNGLKALEGAQKIAYKTVMDEIDKRRQVEVVVKDDSGKVKKKIKIKGQLPKEFTRIVQLASARKNIMLVGPTGCGKSYIAEKLAEVLGLSFASISCSAGMSESQIQGWLVPGKGGEFCYKESPFVRCYRDGGVYLIDEMDSADPNTLTILNSALANGHMFIPHYTKDGGRIDKHKDFVCVAAANTWGQGADMMYVGRNQLDAATLERFKIGMIFMDYDPGVEEAVVEKQVLAWGREIRKAINENQLRRTSSLRFMIDCSDMRKAASWDLEQFEASMFAGWTPDEVEVCRERGRNAWKAV